MLLTIFSNKIYLDLSVTYQSFKPEHARELEHKLFTFNTILSVNGYVHVHDHG